MVTEVIYTVFQKSDDANLKKNNSVKNELILVIWVYRIPKKRHIDDYKCIHLTCKM